MKSSLIQFIEKYRDSKLRRSSLWKLWKEIDKEDFDNNSEETFSWFLEYKESRGK